MSVIIPRDGAPGDFLLIDLLVSSSNLSLFDVSVSRTSSRNNLTRAVTFGSSYANFSSDDAIHHPGHATGSAGGN